MYNFYKKNISHKFIFRRLENNTGDGLDFYYQNSIDTAQKQAASERQKLNNKVQKETLKIPEIPAGHDLMNSAQNANILRHLQGKLHPEIFAKNLKTLAIKKANEITDFMETMQGETQKAFQSIFENPDLTPAERQTKLIALYQKPEVQKAIAEINKTIPGASSGWEKFLENLQSGASERFESMESYIKSWGSIGEGVEDFGISANGAFAGATFGFAISVPWMDSWKEPYSVISMALGTFIFSNTYTAGYGTAMAIKILEGAGGVLEEIRKQGFNIANGFRDGLPLDLINNTLGKQKARLSDMQQQFADYDEPLRGYWLRINNERNFGFDNNPDETANFEPHEVAEIAALVHVGSKNSMTPEQQIRFADQLRGSDGRTEPLLLKKYMADSALGGLHAYFMENPEYTHIYKKHLREAQLGQLEKTLTEKSATIYHKNIVGGMSIENYSKMQGSTEWRSEVAMSLNSASGLMAWAMIMTQLLAYGVLGISKISEKLFGGRNEADENEKTRTKMRTYSGALQTLAEEGAAGKSRKFSKVVDLLARPQYQKRKATKMGRMGWTGDKESQGIITAEEAKKLENTLTKEQKIGLMTQIAAGNLLGVETQSGREAFLAMTISKKNDQENQPHTSVKEILNITAKKEKTWQENLLTKRAKIYAKMSAIKKQAEKKHNGNEAKILENRSQRNLVIALLEQWGGEAFEKLVNYRGEVSDRDSQRGGEKNNAKATNLYKIMEEVLNKAPTEVQEKAEKSYLDEAKAWAVDAFKKASGKIKWNSSGTV
jgi:hypothetical protein